MQQTHVNMINKEFNVNIQLRETDLRYLIKRNLHEGH
jgi:hypothetical protein